VDESERLIALAAMAGPERSLAAWQQWRTANDVAQASALLGWAAGYIHRNLEAAGVHDRYLGGIARHNWISNNRRVIAALPTIHALAALGPLTPLKSFGMSQTHFSRGLRPIADFDFFLPHRSLAAARDLLAERGFHPQLALSTAEFDDRVLPQRGSWNFLGSIGGADLDLHWRLLEHLPTSLSERLIRANSTLVDTEFGRVRHLDPELMIVCLAVHHLVQGGGTWNGMFDVHHLIAHVDPARVVALSYRVGVSQELSGVIREIRSCSRMTPPTPCVYSTIASPPPPARGRPRASLGWPGFSDAQHCATRHAIASRPWPPLAGVCGCSWVARGGLSGSCGDSVR
jgi:hypothetical protein